MSSLEFPAQHLLRYVRLCKIFTQSYTTQYAQQ